MDFGEMFRVIRQQWIVAAIAMLVTVVATVGVYLAWPDQYQSAAQITLIGSRALATQPGSGNNPYLTVGNLGPLAGALAVNVSSDQAVQQLKALGVTDPYTIEVPATATGPFLAITVTGTNKAEIMRSIWTIINFSAQRLIQMQANTHIPIPKKSLIQSQVMAQPNVPTPMLKAKIAVGAGVAVTCIVLSFLLIFGLENARIRRAAKSMRRRPVRTTGSPAEPIRKEQDTSQKAAPTDPQPTGTEPEPMVTSAAADPFAAYSLPALEPENISFGAPKGTSSVDGPSTNRSASPADDLGASTPGGGGSGSASPVSYPGSSTWGASIWGSSPPADRSSSPADGAADDLGASASDGEDSGSASPVSDPGSSRRTSIWDSSPAAGRSASPADDLGASASDGWDSRRPSIWDSGPPAGRSASAADDLGVSASDGPDRDRSASLAEEVLDDDWQEKTLPSIPVIR
jgi:hypothetical protein